MRSYFYAWYLVVLGIWIRYFILASFTGLFLLCEELGWRGYLLPRLLPMGTWRAILICSAIWGLWYIPAFLGGLGDKERPLLWFAIQLGLRLPLGAILSWLYLETRSPWAPALAHGAIYASVELAPQFLDPATDLLWGGSLGASAGWIGMALFIAWLVYTNRLPRIRVLARAG